MDLPRIVLVHIPKTGGNSLMSAFEEVYPKARRAPFIMGSDRPDPSTLADYDLIAGHFGYSYARQLGGQMVTMLREPISRVLSFYNFWSTFPPGTKEHEAVAGKSLRQYLESGHPSVITDVRNTQSWQIAHDTLISSRKAAGDISDDDLLVLAKARLADYAVVGTTEDMAGFAARVIELGVPLGRIGVHNATRRAPPDIDEETLGFVRDMVRVDIALYDFVCDGLLVDRRDPQPAGNGRTHHFIDTRHSPLVDPEELRALGLPNPAAHAKDICGIDLDGEAMRAWWERNEGAISGAALPTVRNGPPRYTENESFAAIDALVLRALIAERRPRLLVDLGSDFATACALDALDDFGLSTKIIAIDRDLRQLRSHLRPDDFSRIELVSRPIQKVPLALFDALRANDILSIDSTHVLKTGSDVHHLLFEVLPRLPVGALIHFQNVPYPFEYPEDWIFGRGQSFNEAYALRAFLMHNVAYSVLFMSGFFAGIGDDLIADRALGGEGTPGTSLWLVKKWPISISAPGAST